MSSRLKVWVLVLLLPVALPGVAYDVTTSADNDKVCIADRMNSGTMNCNAKEFTVSPSLSAETGTQPFCLAGSTTSLKIEVNLFGSNANRFDIAFWTGQNGNDPAVDTVGNAAACSVAKFPTTGTIPGTWYDGDGGGDTCGDFTAAGNSTSLVDTIKAICEPGPTGYLKVPYVLTYRGPGGSNTLCTTTDSITSADSSKCNKGTAEVNGATAVAVGGWMDVTKQTTPDESGLPVGSRTSFSYTAAVPVGSKVMVLTGATLTGNTYTGGTFTPANLTAATNTVNFTLKDGETARIFVNAETVAKTLTVTEAQAAGWDPDALAISCSNQQGAPITDLDGDVATRTMTANISTTNYAGSCTITNRKRPAITLTKVSVGDVGTFNFTGNNTWASQNITTVTSGVGVAGVTQYLPVGVATTITETAPAGYRVSSISCTNSAGTVTTDTTARTIAINAAAMGAGETVNCTVTNQRQRSLQTAKVLSPLSDSGLFVMNANGTLSAEGGNGTIAARIVDVGATVTASESAGTGTSLANYTSTYACENASTNALLFNGSGNSVSFTMPNVDVACLITNTRKSASLVLRKTWVNAINGNTATVTSAGFTNNATSGASVSTGNNTTTGASSTVYAGEAGTLSESFGVGNSNNYNASVACTGTSGLSGTTLTVDPADTAIVCTYTNTRKSASFTLRKSWSNAVNGHTATVTSSGFTNNATSGASVSTGNNTTTGTSVTVYAAESGTVSESFSVGSAASYVSVLSCSGNATALAGNNLTINAADTAITCTYTNNGPGPNLTVNKTVSVIDDTVSVANDKAIPGATMRYTITLQNTSGAFSSDAVVVMDNFDDSKLTYVPGSVNVSDGSPVVVSDVGGVGGKDDRITVNAPAIPAGNTVTVTFDVKID